MRSLFVVAILLVQSLSSVAAADLAQATWEERIRNTCSAENPHPPTTDLGAQLNHLQDRFKTREQRIADPEALVQALDEVLMQTEFAPIVGCPARLREAGKTFAVDFLDHNIREPQSMYVQPHYSDSNRFLGATLHVDLNKPIQRVLFVYLHEMTHICQMPAQGARGEAFFAAWNELTESESHLYEQLKYNDRQGLDRALLSKFKKVDHLAAEYTRHNIFAEVEAYYTMILAYRSLSSQTPRLCREEGQRQSEQVLFEGYSLGERDIAAGLHAPLMIYAHLTESTRPEFLFDMNTPERTFTVPSNGSTFTMRKLHPQMRALIQQADIPLAPEF